METFPTELGVLTCLAILAASMWMPYVIGVSKLPQVEGAPDGFIRPANPHLLPEWIHRAHRAHLNLLEQLVPFAILVFLVDRMDGFTALTYWTAIVFFGLRVAHAVGYITAWARMPLRPLIFTGGWICCAIMAYAVFAA